jgi:hypothetical protein
MIFRFYKEYYQQTRNPCTMPMMVSLPGPMPSITENRMIVLEALMGARSRLGPYGILRTTKDSERELLDKCLVLASEYSFQGYKKFKKDWDDRCYYDKGMLKRSCNLMVDDFVGEVTEYVAPLLDIERIIDPYVKAIAIVETWRGESDFVEAWNVFFKGEHEMSNARFVYLGYSFDKFIGCNHPFVKHDNSARQVFCQFTYHQLGRFWEKAWMTVKALLIMDCLEVWANDRFTRSGIFGETFDFDF